MRSYWGKAGIQVMIFTERTIVSEIDFARLGLVFYRFCISKFYMRFGLKNESIFKTNFEKPLIFSFPQCIDEETEVPE